MKAKRVVVHPLSRQIFEQFDTSDSQEPLSAGGIGNNNNSGEQSPCTPTESVFSFNENVFKTPKVCPPTPTKTPSTFKKRNIQVSNLKAPLFESESEESDNDENKFTISSGVPSSTKKRYQNFTLPQPILRSPLQHLNNQQQQGNNVKSHSDSTKQFTLLQQIDDDEELVPSSSKKKRPISSIHTSPVLGRNNILGGTPNFNNIPSWNRMDTSLDDSPMCPPSSIKRNTKSIKHDLQQKTASTTNWFASPGDQKPISLFESSSPILFSSSKGSIFDSQSKQEGNSSPDLFSKIRGTGSTNNLCLDDDEDLYDSKRLDDEYVSSEDEIPEDFTDLQSQTHMEASTPPRLTQSQSQPTDLNIQTVPCRLTTEEVHENPFSPERNFKKTKVNDDLFSLSDDKDSFLTSSKKHFKSPKPRKSINNTSSETSPNNNNNSSNGEIEPIIEAYFSRYLEDFEEVCVLGNGSFGRVTKCKNRYDGMFYAVKQMKRKIKGKKDMDKILKEVQALATLVDNPYLVRYYAGWLEGTQKQLTLCIQTELCNGGSLSRNIGKHIFNESELIDMLRQLASGLMQMHAQNIVHLDLKPENIYLTSALEEKPRYKIGDLGLAASSLETLKDIVEGDSRYLAKELLNLEENAQFDLTKADIFSLGATIYECAIGKPLPNNGAEWHEIRNGFLRLPSHFSIGFRDLLLSMLHINPDQRPTALNLLQNPLVAEQKLSESELLQIIKHQQEIINKLKGQEAILRQKIEELQQ
ncbi:hypothetical protein ABK040_010335 [Willaertia magna]